MAIVRRIYNIVSFDVNLRASIISVGQSMELIILLCNKFEFELDFINITILPSIYYYNILTSVLSTDN